MHATRSLAPRSLVDQALKPSGSGSGGGSNATVNAILANHAVGETGIGGVAVTATPNAVGIVKIANFTMTAGGKGKLRLEGTATFGNSDGAAPHKVALGIKAVVAGSAPPTSWDYPNPPVGIGSNSVSVQVIGVGGGNTAGSAIVWEYGAANALAPLVPGTSYDLYLMAVADAGGAISVAQHGAQLDAQEMV